MSRIRPLYHYGAALRLATALSLFRIYRLPICQVGLTRQLVQVQVSRRRRGLGTLGRMLLLLHQVLEFFLIKGLLLFLLFDGFLNGILVGEHLFIQLLARVLGALRVELPLLSDDLEPPVHVPELKVGTCRRANVPILIYGWPQYYSLIEKIGDLLILH